MEEESIELVKELMVKRRKNERLHMNDELKLMDQVMKDYPSQPDKTESVRIA